jgi:hypothetical protein
MRQCPQVTEETRPRQGQGQGEIYILNVYQEPPPTPEHRGPTLPILACLTRSHRASHSVSHCYTLRNHLSSSLRHSGDRPTRNTRACVPLEHHLKRRHVIGLCER